MENFTSEIRVGGEILCAGEWRVYSPVESVVGHKRKSKTVPGESAPGGQADVTRQKADILVDLDRQHWELLKNEAGRYHELRDLLRPIWPRTPRYRQFGQDATIRHAVRLLGGLA